MDKERGGEGASGVKRREGGRLGDHGHGMGGEGMVGTDWLGETVEERLGVMLHALDTSPRPRAIGGRK